MMLPSEQESFMQIKENVLAFLIGVVLVAAVNAQVEPLRMKTDPVTVNVTLRDKDGKYVKGLRQEQFEIFDNKPGSRFHTSLRKTQPFPSASFTTCTRRQRIAQTPF
jgi:hypothetical protein